MNEPTRFLRVSIETSFGVNRFLSRLIPLDIEILKDDPSILIQLITEADRELTNSIIKEESLR